MKNCKYCDKQIPKEKRNNIFCNLSCANSYNNIIKHNKDCSDTQIKYLVVENLKKLETKYCKYCNSELAIDKKNNTFCNKSCANSYNNHNRILSLETKNKISSSLKGRISHNKKNINNDSIFIKKNKELLSNDRNKYCENCNKELTLVQTKRNNIFCSNKCANIFNTNNTNIIFVNTNKNCKYCDKELTLVQIKRNNIFCSNDCRCKNGVSDETRQKLKNIMQLRVVNGLHHGWSTRNIESYPEKFFKKVLENNNIEYEFNKPIVKKSLGMNELGNYFLDFFITSKNIDLEIDGKQHLLEERKESDEKRDEYLIKNNILVYRIKWENINSMNGKEYIKNEIDKFIDFYNKK